MPGFRPAKYFVAFDGQSLNLLPGSPNTYPELLMASFPSVTWKNVAIGSSSYTVLGAGTSIETAAARRVDKHAKNALNRIWIGVGGTTDLTGELDSGAQLYADIKAYANARRSAGYGYIIITTVTPSSTAITGSKETARVACNDALRNASSTDPGVFDAVIDFDAVAGLNDSTSASYADNLHWSIAGSGLAASTVAPYLTTAAP